jgi:hypothetical protein
MFRRVENPDLSAQGVMRALADGKVVVTSEAELYALSPNTREVRRYDTDEEKWVVDFDVTVDWLLGASMYLLERVGRLCEGPEVAQ